MHFECQSAEGPDRALAHRSNPMNVRTFSLVLMVLAVSAPAALSVRADDEPKPDKGMRPVLNALLEAHNEERAKAKLPPLTANSQLEAAALVHARDMARNQMLSHDGSDGSKPVDRVEKAGYHYQRTGENVAEGSERVSGVMRQWMESPEHKMNILGNYSEMGGAYVKSSDGQTYWCVELGLPWPELTPQRARTDFVEALNAERKKAKQPSLKSNRVLMAAAQKHAHDSAARDKLAEKDDDGITPFDRIQNSGARFRRIVEESASGIGSAQEVVESFLERRADRDNVMGNFSDIGVGYATSSKGRPYWCIILGRSFR